jgi:hypothetical protein
VGKWVWTGIALVVIGAEVGSRLCCVTWVWSAPKAGCRSIQVGDGAFRISSYSTYIWLRRGWHFQPSPDVTFGWPAPKGNPPTPSWRWGFQRSDLPMYGKSDAVSLLYPALLTTAPAVLFWRADIRAWRRERRGLCGKCGYDLSGIAAESPCPECGSPAHRDLAPPLAASGAIRDQA